MSKYEIIPGYDCLADIKRIRDEIWEECGGNIDVLHEKLELAAIDMRKQWGSPERM